MAKSNRKRIEELQALGRMLTDPAGRRWMWLMLGECHVWHTSMASNGLRLAFLEGERNQGLRLLGEIQEANPDMFIQMIKEHHSARTSGGSTGSDYDPISGNDPASTDTDASDR